MLTRVELILEHMLENRRRDGVDPDGHRKPDHGEESSLPCRELDDFPAPEAQEPEDGQLVAFAFCGSVEAGGEGGDRAGNADAGDEPKKPGELAVERADVVDPLALVENGDFF